MNPNEAFQSHYLSLSVKDRAMLTRKLRVHLGVTANTISNWRHSRTSIKPIYQREITKVLGTDIFTDSVI